MIVGTGVETAIRATIARVNEISPDATPEQLAYLGKAIESVGGSATLYDIISAGDESIENISALSVEKLDALNAALTQALLDVGAESTDQLDRIQIAGSGELTGIQAAGLSQISAIDEAKTTATDAVDSAGSTQISAIEQLGGQILAPDHNGILADSSPFMFAVAEMYSCNGNSFTSELGQLYNNKGAILFELIAGMQDTKARQKWINPPTLQFIQNDLWHYADQRTEYACSGSRYNYPLFMLSLMFVKNTTDAPITRTINHFHSSYWGSGYGGASLNIGTPNANNDTDPTSISWVTGYSYSSSNQEINTNTNITIPANTTVAIVKFNSAHYWTNSNGYQYILRHGYDAMRNFLKDGLEVDINRTLKAQQSNLNSITDVWL